MERYDKFARGQFYVELWLPTTQDEPLECLVKIYRGGLKVKSGKVPLDRFPTPLPNAKEMEALLAAADALIAEVSVP
ncbi:MAG: hypothetical protein HYT14_00940 [Candidatus Liptonbacteria bacterium]|nr:hypothetical protein [Candidatus Liptonbacteria bacterium]